MKILFEGLKAYPKEGGNILLFPSVENAVSNEGSLVKISFISLPCKTYGMYY